MNPGIRAGIKSGRTHAWKPKSCVAGPIGRGRFLHVGEFARGHLAIAHDVRQLGDYMLGRIVHEPGRLQRREVIGRRGPERIQRAISQARDGVAENLVIQDFLRALCPPNVRFMVCQAESPINAAAISA